MKKRQQIQKMRAVMVGREIAYNIELHPARARTPEYERSKKALAAIVKTLGKSWYFASGSEPYEDHHGGGLWVYDADGWFFLKNLVGIEWCTQFCADPRKIDVLRRNARRLYAGFPQSFDAFEKIGVDLRSLLEIEIKNAAGVARWTDSICNASVPLPQRFHTGVLPEGAGVHNYPTPITDVDRFRRDDFDLWRTEPQTGIPR